jgi:hypothetical protein
VYLVAAFELYPEFYHIDQEVTYIVCEAAMVRTITICENEEYPRVNQGIAINHHRATVFESLNSGLVDGLCRLQRVLENVLLTACTLLYLSIDFQDENTCQFQKEELMCILFVKILDQSIDL